MKKAIYESILSLISTIDTPEADEVREEVTAELAKGKEKAEANRALYEQAHDVVIGALTDTPVTIAELYEEVKDQLPEGFTKAKVQYALGHYWESEVTVTKDKVNAYSKA